MLKLAEQHIMSLEPYLSGRSIESDLNIATWAKLGSNENCLGPSRMALKAISDNLYQCHLYPNGNRPLLVEKICEHFKEFGIKRNQVALGNGTSELIVNLVRCLLGPNESLLFCWPTFVMYSVAASAHGREWVAVPVKADMTFDVELMIAKIKDRSRFVKLVFLANPNNPTGKYLNHRELKEVVDKIPPDVVLVIDEAYGEYVTNGDYPSGIIHALARPRTIVLRTLSKIYGLAGLRLGYAIGDASIIDLLCRIRDPFNVNSLAQHAALAALDDQQHVKNSVLHNLEYRPILAEGLRKFGFSVCDGVGNFVTVKRANAMPNIAEIFNKLFAQGVIIRPLASFGLSEWMRVSVGTKQEISQLFESLEMVLKLHQRC